MALFDDLLPSRLAYSKNKQAVLDFLKPLVLNPYWFFICKNTLLQWAKYNDVHITGKDVDFLRGAP